MALFGRKNKQDATLGKPPMGRGVPGVQKDENVDPEMEAMLLTAPAGQWHIGRTETAEAISILSDYKKGKASLEGHVVQSELWWELRHWETIRKGKQRTDNPEYRGSEPSSVWPFNAILNRYADAMDNYPEPVVLPRECSDEESAKVLSSALPVILEYNDYEQIYFDNWWKKLKHGTAVYGVFWNSVKENGLGDVDIREINPLKLFWGPGVTNIQKSRNPFIVDLMDEDLPEQQYPEHEDHLSGGAVDVKQYIYDDTIDTSNKSAVVDRYYETISAGSKTLLHYTKFVGETLLFASENDPNYQGMGWYGHGLYPTVLDVMFSEKGMPAGFGYVAIYKDLQLYIDKLSSNILENSMMTIKKRFFVSGNTGINEEEFPDWSKLLIHVQGEPDDGHVKEIVTNPLDDIYMTVAQTKIEEMKDAAANHDVSGGSAGSGVTAAAVIAALQEAGNKASRDMISVSYRTYVKTNSMRIKLIRQFYDETRPSHITGQTPGSYQLINMNNANIEEQEVGQTPDGPPFYRKPVFDLKTKAQEKNPFSCMEQNERAKGLYGLGPLNPERAQEALGALEMMESEGVDKVKEQVQGGQTLLNICQQMSQQFDQMALITQTLTGKDMGIGVAQPTGVGQQGQAVGPAPSSEKDNLASGIMEAQHLMTGYGERLAKRSIPSMGNE